MRLALIVGVLMALVHTTAFAQENQPPSTLSPSQVEAAKRLQAEQMKELEQFAIRREVVSLEARAKEAKQAVENLRIARENARKVLQELRSSNEGRAFALDRAGEINMYRAVWARLDEIKTEDLDQWAASATETLDWIKTQPSSMPEPNIRDSMVTIGGWAAKYLDHIAGDQAAIRHAVTNAAKGVNGDSLPTLENVLAVRDAEEAKVRGQALAAARQEALTEANRLAFETEKAKVIERARKEEGVRLAQARNEILRRDVEAIEKAKKEETELIARRMMAETAQKDRIAQLEREAKIMDAERARQNAQAAVAAKQIEDDAQMKRDREEVRTSPRVKALLAGPFFTAGYYQPAPEAVTERQKRPISLSALSNYGALEESDDGLQRLLDVGTWDGDRVRPRWRYNHDLRGVQDNASHYEELLEAQKLLRRLGSAMVEKGKLSK